MKTTNSEQVNKLQITQHTERRHRHFNKLNVSHEHVWAIQHIIGSAERTIKDDACNLSVLKDLTVLRVGFLSIEIRSAW